MKQGVVNNTLGVLILTGVCLQLMQQLDLAPQPPLQ